MRTWAYANSNRKSKNCEFCGRRYKPTGSTQLWCAVCAPNRFFMKLIRAFGINKARFEAILKAQDYKCAICRVPFHKKRKPGEVHANPYPCVDHCHTSQRFRGLLCLRCNTRLGGQGDEVAWLLSALRYLGKDLPKEVRKWATT